MPKRPLALAVLFSVAATLGCNKPPQPAPEETSAAPVVLAPPTRVVPTPAAVRTNEELVEMARKDATSNYGEFGETHYATGTLELTLAASRSTDTAWAGYLTLLAAARHGALRSRVMSSQDEAVNLYSAIISSYSTAGFPIDDPVLGGKKGQPLKPYARIRLSGIFQNWLDSEGSMGNRKGLAARELELLMAEDPDPSLEMIGLYTTDKAPIAGSVMIGLMRVHEMSDKRRPIAEHYLKKPNMEFLWIGWWHGETHPEALMYLADQEKDPSKKLELFMRVIEEHPKAWFGKIGSDDTGAYSMEAYGKAVALASDEPAKIALCKRILKWLEARIF